MKKVLITGGAGFIGSHVNKHLGEAGYQTVVIDNLSTGSEQAVTSGTFIQGNCGDRDLLDSLFSQHKIDAVMHLAASIDVGESVQNPAKYYENNVANTLNLLELCVKYGVKAFIFSSSATVYGLCKNTSGFKETDPCHPLNPYGESKWIGEKMLRAYDSAYGLKSISLRYFNAAGGDPAGEIKNYKRAESNLIPLLLRKRAVTLFGTDYETPDGTCLRDYIHVYDLAHAHLLALEQLLAGGETDVYNLGNGRCTSVKEVIEAAKCVTGFPIVVKEGMRRAGDPPLLLANIHKAKEKLKWTPHYPDIEAMIQHAFDALS